MKNAKIMIWAGIAAIALAVIADAWWWSSRDIQAPWEAASIAVMGIAAVLLVVGIVFLVAGCLKKKKQTKQ